MWVGVVLLGSLVTWHYWCHCVVSHKGLSHKKVVRFARWWGQLEPSAIGSSLRVVAVDTNLHKPSVVAEGKRPTAEQSKARTRPIAAEAGAPNLHTLGHQTVARDLVDKLWLTACANKL